MHFSIFAVPYVNERVSKKKVLSLSLYAPLSINDVIEGCFFDLDIVRTFRGGRSLKSKPN